MRNEEKLAICTLIVSVFIGFFGMYHLGFYFGKSKQIKIQAEQLIPTKVKLVGEQLKKCEEQGGRYSLFYIEPFFQDKGEYVEKCEIPEKVINLN